MSKSGVAVSRTAVNDQQDRISASLPRVEIHCSIPPIGTNSDVENCWASDGRC